MFAHSHPSPSTDAVVHKMRPISAITSGNLISRLQQGSSLVVVDVRDDDRDGGHIKGSVHVPSHDFKRRLSDLIIQWKSKPAIVFHCMLSQKRGPSCASAFVRSLEDAIERGAIDKAPEVLILEGGFMAFARHYSDETKALYESFQPSLYRI